MIRDLAPLIKLLVLLWSSLGINECSFQLMLAAETQCGAPGGFSNNRVGHLGTTPKKHCKLRNQNITQTFKQKQYLCMTVTPYKRNVLPKLPLVRAFQLQPMASVGRKQQDTRACWKCHGPGIPSLWKRSLSHPYSHCPLSVPLF